jgi:hypothetical protein
MQFRAFVVLSLLAVAACNSSPTGVTPDVGGGADGGDTGDSGVDVEPASSCAACVTTNDCTATEICLQFASDSQCAVSCMTDTDCAATDRCVLLTSVEGNNAGGCVHRDDTCGALPSGADGGVIVTTHADAGPGGQDAGSGTGYCGSLASPSVSGTHCTCRSRTGTCDPNNCYGGYYCDTTNNRCVPPPANCNPSNSPDGGPGGQDAGPVTTPDAGPVVGPTGPVDAHNGGQVDNLLFAVVGDTRPGYINDTAKYPTAIITGIYSAVAHLNPQPSFVVTTGDYMFASTSNSEGAKQLAIYMQAASQVSIPLWPAMGNHECTGATASNCGPENGNITANYNDFISSMMTPIGETLPYYTRRVDAKDGSWTSKFVYVAPNAWGPIESAWFRQQLSVPTTYTFVVHHEPSAATQAPGMSEVNSITQSNAVTLSIVGHTHTWTHKTGEVVIGNGGAPLTGGRYGYTLFNRRSTDGAIQVTAYDYTNNQQFAQFAVKADGSAAP